MSARKSTASRRVFSASAALECIALALTEIKHEDELTDADMGAVLGKSEDMAAKYRTGLATMDAVTFARGKREWNGRFTGYLDQLCEKSRPGQGNDRKGHSKILAAALALSVALEDDDAVDTEEVRANRSTLEAARDAIDDQLRKLRPAA
jgi:hypothetical protein